MWPAQTTSGGGGCQAALGAKVPGEPQLGAGAGEHVDQLEDISVDQQSAYTKIKMRVICHRQGSI